VPQYQAFVLCLGGVCHRPGKIISMTVVGLSIDVLGCPQPMMKSNALILVKKNCTVSRMLETETEDNAHLAGCTY
jgi:uncharacterized OsmC-like protein